MLFTLKFNISHHEYIYFSYFCVIFLITLIIVWHIHVLLVVVARFERLTAVTRLLFGSSFSTMQWGFLASEVFFFLFMCLVFCLLKLYVIYSRQFYWDIWYSSHHFFPCKFVLYIRSTVCSYIVSVQCAIPSIMIMCWLMLVVVLSSHCWLLCIS